MEREGEQQNENGSGVEQTIYMRYKKELAKDDDGNDLNIDFLLNKFKQEFDQLENLSRVRQDTLKN
jgi:hypothetical protein|tara:strand:+ start:1393 stop:1590 length:198 start_codon:yes stop_codon:yes gene_type:complete